MATVYVARTFAQIAEDHGDDDDCVCITDETLLLQAYVYVIIYLLICWSTVDDICTTAVGK